MISPTQGWEGDHVGYSNVLFEGETFKMIYWGLGGGPHTPTGAIGYATSTDAVSWSKYVGNPTFAPSYGVGWAYTVRTNSTHLYMYYGNWTEDHQIGYTQTVYLAYSIDDGYNWIEYTKTNLWSYGKIGVCKDGNVWHALSCNPSSDSLDYWNSSDGINWLYYSGNPILQPSPPYNYLATPYLTVVNGRLCAWYAMQQEYWWVGIGRAYADETNLHWTPYEGNPVLTRGTGWEEAHISIPHLVEAGATTYMFYTGMSYGWTGPERIGLAYMNKTLSEVIPPIEYYLTVQTYPVGITSIPGEGLYDKGNDVSLQATAVVSISLGEQYRFDHWTVDDIEIVGNPITVHMDANHTATAHYVLQYYLSVGTSPEPLAPVPTGKDWYDKCTSVELLAPPTAYYMDTKVMSFDYWTVDGATIVGNPITVHMDAPHTAIAHYYARAVIDIKPDALNLGSEGEWITAYIELPEGYNVADINISTVMLNGTIPVDPLAPTAMGDYDSDGVPDLMIKFDRATVISYIMGNIDIEGRFATTTLTITGYLNDGTPFQGSDTIKIIMPMPRHWRLVEFY